VATQDPTLTAAEPPGEGLQAGLLLRTLLLLTAVTGIVDAVSYLVLGRVFVANMTGNVVFLGFAVSGAKQLSIAASIVALLAFMAGALIGGRLGVRLGAHRGRHLAAGMALTTTFVAAALLVASFPSRPLSDVPRYALIVLLAVGMGIQNATARKLAVADATTNVLTLTITGLAADSALAGGTNPRPWRRIGSVATMFAGALVGGLLVRLVDLRAALALAVVLLVAVTYLVLARARRTPASEWDAAK
jgi:uncharacterized membrane protein YoaK (UPF0700 family)